MIYLNKTDGKKKWNVSYLVKSLQTKIFLSLLINIRSDLFYLIYYWSKLKSNHKQIYKCMFGFLIEFMFDKVRRFLQTIHGHIIPRPFYAGLTVFRKSWYKTDRSQRTNTRDCVILLACMFHWVESLVSIIEEFMIQKKIQSAFKIYLENKYFQTKK